GLLLGAAGLLALRRFAPDTFDLFISYVTPRDGADTGSAGGDTADDRAFTEFIAAFKAGPPVKAPAASAAKGAPIADGAGAVVTQGERAVPEPLKQFFAQAPARLGKARKRLQEAERTTEQALRQDALGALSREVRDIKGMAGVPGLLPAWQLASILESLLKQLVLKPDKVTASTLASITAGLDVVGDLCQPQKTPVLQWVSTEWGCFLPHIACRSHLRFG
ncbi:MAG: hypothetical protein ACREIC_20390, partial [Limisphaerales bacterium]